MKPVTSEELGIFGDTPLYEAIEILNMHRSEGFVCPCCGALAKEYKRKISSAMAYGLFLVSQSPDEYVHLEQFFKGCKDLPPSVRGDVPKMVFWGLLERKTGPKEDGNPNNGWYRVTQKGTDFLTNGIPVHAYLTIYNNEVVAMSAEMVNYETIIKNNKFNYNKDIQHG